jgi:prepilin-type N-terminal cleavage/methylation domain-containing protein/prepilin-type processing-associated H-X9-DG protein
MSGVCFYKGGGMRIVYPLEIISKPAINSTLKLSNFLPNNDLFKEMIMMPKIYNKQKDIRRRAFTLIELLVVIAIIAILAAILFPVFAQAREKARQISCLSNMKQISLAFLQYTQDYDEIPPSSSVYSGSGGWGGQIYPYVKTASAFRCPDDSQEPAGENDTSYGYNGNLLAHNISVAKWTAPAETVMLFEVTGNTNVDVTQPVDSISYWNGGSPTGYGLGDLTQNQAAYDPGGGGFISACPAPGGGGWWNTETLKYATGIMGQRSDAGDCEFANPRHTGGSNFAFCDGHAKWFRPENVSSGEMVENFWFWGWGNSRVDQNQDDLGWMHDPAGTSGKMLNGQPTVATFSWM